MKTFMRIWKLCKFNLNNITKKYSGVCMIRSLSIR